MYDKVGRKYLEPLPAGMWRSTESAILNPLHQQADSMPLSFKG
jgi:hypothetical protein